MVRIFRPETANKMTADGESTQDLFNEIGMLVDDILSKTVSNTADTSPHSSPRSRNLVSLAGSLNSDKKEDSSKSRENIRLLKKEINDLKRWKSLHIGKLQELDKLRIAVREKDESIAELQELIEENSTEMQKLNLHARKRSALVHDLEDKVEKLTEDERELNHLQKIFKKKKAGKIDSRVSKALTEKHTMKMEIKNMKDKHAKEMKQIKEKLKKADKDYAKMEKDYKKQLKDADYKVQLAQRALAETISANDNMTAEVLELNKEKADLIQRLKTRNAKVSEMDVQIQKLERSLNTHTRSLQKTENALKTKAQKQLKNQSKKADHQMKTQDALLAKLEKELQENEKRFSRQAHKIARLERLLTEIRKDAGVKLQSSGSSLQVLSFDEAVMSEDRSRRGSYSSENSASTVNSNGRASRAKTRGDGDPTNGSRTSRSTSRTRKKGRKIRRDKSTRGKKDATKLDMAEEILDGLQNEQDRSVVRLDSMRGRAQQITWEMSFGRKTTM